MKKPQKPGLKKNFKKKIGVIGVGYVGLPLIINLSKYFDVIAFDKNPLRILELNKGVDKNKEFTGKNLKSKKILFTNNYEELNNCNVFILTLPTPLNKKKIPDISIVLSATIELAKKIKKKDLIIFESTFYPGTVDDHLIPILEKFSGLKSNVDFYVGYSSERINPGDKIHRFENVVKVISGSNKSSLKKVKDIYKNIVKAGVYEASNIKSAELSKILENTQRFINIALMNDISKLCNQMNLSTKEVIDIAATKWNFSRFYPGLVGGHCIAVDPLYLSFKQKSLGLSSRLIDEANRINSSKHSDLLEEIKKKFPNQKKIKLLFLGLTFKENCPDLRNSGSLNLIKKLNSVKVIPYVHDPYFDENNTSDLRTLKFKFLKKIKQSDYNCIILAVPHDYYKKIGIKKIKQFSTVKNCLIFDLKSVFKRDSVHYQM